MERDSEFRLGCIGFAGILIAIAVGVLGFRSFFVTSPGEVTLLKTLGEMDPAIYTEGLHFKNPFFGKTITINTRGVKVSEDAQASTNDLQKVTVSVAVTYQVKGNDGILTLYRKIGDDNMIEDIVAKPNIRESVRAIFAQYKADELVTKRKEVGEKITAYLEGQLSGFGLDVTDVNVSDVNFSDAFDKSVEAKVQAEQNALAEKNKLEQIKFQAQQQIEKAKAEAETIKIQSEAIKNNGGKEYVMLKFIEKWNGTLPQYSMGQDSNILVNLMNK